MSSFDGPPNGEYLNPSPVIYIDKNNQEHHNIQIYQFSDEDPHQDQQVLLIMDQEETINSNQNAHFDSNLKKQASPSNTVPALSNVDEIFQLLSQKIAKYCQVLADLTNCEVFYKAQLPLPQINEANSGQKPKSKYKQKTKNPQIRSLYWGTHQMLFQYSHNQGLKYDKSQGDSLIKINQRSLSSDVTNLIEEILNEPSLTLKQSKLASSKAKKTNLNLNERKVDIKDCCVYLNRLDDSIFDQYLNKFELSNNQMSCLNKHEYEEDLRLPGEEELYSDEYRINFNKFINKSERLNGSGNNEDEDEEDDEDDLDEKALLVKNCFGLNDNEEDYYSCEYCINHSYKHLTQLKLHQLRVHENIPIINENSDDYECAKCKLNLFENRVDYVKHILLCFYPDLYSCKTCHQSFSNYSQYLFHTKYVHTHVVYMCAICGRKYRQIKDLLDHDQLMHSKSLNYCEICFEQQKSRKSLYDHYQTAHLTTLNAESSTSNLISNQIEQINENSKIVDSDQVEIVPQTKSIIEFVLTEPEEINKSPELDKIDSSPEETSTDWSKVQKNDLIRGLIDRKHQCKWCSLRFYTKSQLKQHETTHINSVLFCPVCDKEFTHKDRLSGHMKCHMEPSLECKVCGKKFKRLCNLYNHELVHGLTEHAFMLCQFCGRGFRSRRDYQNHVIANHRDLLMKSNNLSQLASNQLANLSETKKSTKRVSKGQSKKSNTSTYQLQNEPTDQFAKTTTVVLTDDHLEEIEPDANNNDPYDTETYFTRTSRELEEEEDEEDLGNIEENQDYINELVNNIESQSFNLNLENNSQEGKRTYKNRNSLKNKIKRLRSSLNIEVLDDEDEQNSETSLASQMVNYVNPHSNQMAYSHDLHDFNGIMHSNVHLVHLSDNLV